MDKSYLLLDIGGSFVKYAVSDAEHHFAANGSLPTPATLEGLLQAIGSIYASCGCVPDGVSVSLPGIIDCGRGLCITGGSLAYNIEQPLAELISRCCGGVPVAIENDAKCAALAEIWRGNLQGHKTAIVIVFGTGVGGSIITNGEVLGGARFAAGELSFICTEPEQFGNAAVHMGESCSTKGLVAQMEEAMGCPPGTLNGEDVFYEVESGESKAAVAFEQFCNRVAIQLFNLSMALAPTRICVGGGISRNPLLVVSLRTAMDALYARLPDSFLPQQLTRPEILPCRFYNDSNLIGALRHFLVAKTQDFVVSI